MKITIPKKELKEALINLSKVVSGNAALPIINAVKISGTKDGIRVTGTNLEQTLVCKISGGDGGGAFIVNLKELKDYLKQGGTSTTVQFEDVGKKIAGLFYADNIPVIKQFTQFPLDEWPELQEVYNKGIKSDTLFSKINQAVPSASKDSTRKVLQSVLIESDAVIATNGKELVKLNCLTGIKESTPIPVTKFLQSASFAKSSGSIAVQEVNGVMQCRLESDKWIYTTKCVDGTYPNYRQVIPKNSSGYINLSDNDIEYLKKGIPLLDCSDELQSIYLYADHLGVKILSADSESMGNTLNVNSAYLGLKHVAVSLDRNLILRALRLGFHRFEFMDGDCFAPITAKGNKGDLFIFMPLQGIDTEKIIKAANTKGSIHVERQEKSSCEREKIQPKENNNMKGSRNAKQVTRRFDPTVRASSSVSTIKQKEKKSMPDETQNRKPLAFKVIEGIEPNSFEELLSCIMEVRGKAKEVFDMTGNLSKKVKDAQKAQKAKEREFKQTKDLLGKLKKVSGF